ncbi:uncharacterized protein LOC141911664 isoform X2 [Tubulanus polymorphus]|uniref:uncharacterized protein LOC141911664 isoform X1 n=1 Tax=Tubulanus polymorphus TaxID=672921 RepID=UPI003DA35E3C
MLNQGMDFEQLIEDEDNGQKSSSPPVTASVPANCEIIEESLTKHNMAETRYRKRAKIISIVLFVAIALILIVDIIRLHEAITNFYNQVAFTCFWEIPTGVLTAAFALAASINPRKCYVITCLVMAIITAIITGILLVRSIPEIVLFSHLVRFLSGNESRDRTRRLILATGIVRFIFSVALFVASIVMAAFGCGATCCRPKTQVTQVIYVGEQHTNRNSTAAE